ncbi:MAG: GAF domain-containing protein [Bacteroidota bacterium]
MGQLVSPSVHQRNIDVSNWLSLILFALSNIVGIVYLINGHSTQITSPIFISSFFYLVPFMLNRFGLFDISRVVLSYTVPLVMYPLSIYNKMMALDDGLINAVFYYDIRVALLCSMVIPTSTISLKERSLFAICIFPSLFGTLLYDPIHNWFGVGYYQVGLEGNNYLFIVNLFTVITYIFFFSSQLFLRSKFEFSESREAIKSSKLESYLDQLMTIGNSKSINLGNVETAYEEICSTAERCLKVSRVGIWEYDKRDHSITCKILLDNGQYDYREEKLNMDDYPIYFKALDQNKLLIARDAFKDERIKELKKGYLEKLNIRSMMDMSFTKDGRFAGVICCEHQGQIKDWRAEDSILLKALGDFVSYAHSAKKRIHQNIELSYKNRQVRNVNQRLEQMVKERTSELEERNQQLTEYAFINSHILRAPVARVSGLMNLAEVLSDEEFKETIMPKLKESVTELEEITTRINSAIELYTVDNQKVEKVHV